MALTFTVEPIEIQGGIGMLGGYRPRFVTVDFDTSYPAGGEAVTAANFGLGSNGTIKGVTLVAVTDGADLCLDVIFDAENSKLMVIDADGSDTADTTDISGVSARLLVIGY